MEPSCDDFVEPAPIVREREPTEESVPKELEHIQALYDNGKPLFTKEAIREVVRAFDAAFTPDNADGRVTVNGFDGVQVEHRLVTGQVSPILAGFDSKSDFV
ncbi:hypothetical protein HJFPF1_02501 [Paramyrothecium foliicola]|nr:hypothetical protein HJFPF1_02501 [Paramyrothecium foliicola]